MGRPSLCALSLIRQVLRTAQAGRKNRSRDNSIEFQDFGIFVVACEALDSDHRSRAACCVSSNVVESPPPPSFRMSLPDKNRQCMLQSQERELATATGRVPGGINEQPSYTCSDGSLAGYNGVVSVLGRDARVLNCLCTRFAFFTASWGFANAALAMPQLN